MNALKRERSQVLADEKQLTATLMNDASIRRGFERGMGLPSGPGSVWLDSDHSWGYTALAPKHLPRWISLSEAFKMFIAWDAGIEFGSAYALNVNLDPGDVQRWDAGRMGIMANIEQRIRRALRRRGLADLPYAYILETRSRSGRSMTKPHLHGFAICDDPLDASTLKVALEEAFAPSLTRNGRQRSVRIERGYDPAGLPEFSARNRWVSYIIKNAHRYDRRLKKRRLFMSDTLKQVAREAWQLRREE